VDERKAFRDEVQEFNEADAKARGVLFEATGWEDTLRGIGRPQAIINEDVRKSDYFILLLWNRWGSRPDSRSSRFTSGTEEEYHVAMECCSQPNKMRQVVIMFKSVDPQQLADPGRELEEVLRFRKKIEQEKTHLYHQFDTVESLRVLLRRHLASWLRDQESGGTPGPSPFAPRGPEMGRLPTNAEMEQQQRDPLERQVAAKARQLAEEGRLTEAEVEFARNIVGQRRPQALIEYGQFLRVVGCLEQAKVMFEAAVTAANDQKDAEAAGRAYGNLGEVLLARGDLDGAEQMLRKALDINERLGRLEGIADAKGDVGNVLRLRGDLDGAEKMYRQSLEINERLGRLERIAIQHNNLGIVLEVRGNLDGAEQMYRRSLQISDRIKHLEGIADSNGNLGNVLRIRGDLDGAERAYRESLEVNKRLGRLERIAMQQTSLGIVLGARGDLDGAEQMLRQALETNERLGLAEGMANCYANLGNLLRIRGDVDAAEQMPRQSLGIYQRLGHLEGMAGTYLNLGILLRGRGDFAGAEQMYRKGLDVARRLRATPQVTQLEWLLQEVRDTQQQGRASD